MLSIITSYLIQSSKGTLPYIGHFTSRYNSAVSNSGNKQILPPGGKIIFKEEAIPASPQLASFIATKKNIAESNATYALDKFCKEWKQKIDAGEILCFQSFGCLQKNESGMISFSPDDKISYYKPVSAIRVLYSDTGHPVLAGDAETTTGVIYNSNEEVSVKKRSWLIWAAVLFVVAVILLGFSLYGHKLSTSAIGNRNHLIINEVGETYMDIKANNGSK